MASVCGIHVDQRRFALVALEGSVKKPRVVATAEGEIPPGEDPVEAVAGALKRAVKKQKIQAETVGLAIDSGLAAFRTLSLPFDDDSKIEEVLKFEVESDLPQWNIEDVVVDYLVLDKRPGVQSDLLVTAVPKDRLQIQLEACERGGLEPNEAELDGTALFHAAKSAGALPEEGAELLVHVGDASTTLVLVDGGRLVSMRAVRAGVAPQAGSETEEAAESDDDEEGEEAPEESPAPEDDEELRARLEGTVRRIRREILRTISGARLANPCTAILVCGRPLPGLTDEPILDVPLAPLVIETAGSDRPLDAGLVIAYGSALRELGLNELQPNLRREELRFTGKFERLELPLAVLCLLIVTALAVQFIITRRQIDLRERDVNTWLSVSNNFLFPDPERNWPGRIKSAPDDFVDFARQAEHGKVADMTSYEALEEVYRRLFIMKDGLEKEIGTKTEFDQPLSALTALMLATHQINSLGDQVGRYSFRSVQADYTRGTGGKDTVTLKFDMDFFADNSVEANVHFTKMRGAFESAPWCTRFAAPSSKPFDDDKGLIVDGITIDVDPRLAPEAAQ